MQSEHFENGKVGLGQRDLWTCFFQPLSQLDSTHFTATFTSIVPQFYPPYPQMLLSQALLQALGFRSNTTHKISTSRKMEIVSLKSRKQIYLMVFPSGTDVDQMCLQPIVKHWCFLSSRFLPVRTIASEHPPRPLCITLSGFRMRGKLT